MVFGFGYFITNLYWISISLTFDESFKFLMPITIILIPAFIALFYGFISFLFLIYKPKKVPISPKNIGWSKLFGDLIKSNVLVNNLDHHYSSSSWHSALLLIYLLFLFSERCNLIQPF